MKFEQARIALAPRSAANCLDLALLVAGRNLGVLVPMWALFAVPLGVITYLAARYSDYGFLVALALGFFGTGPLGAMLIAGAARYSFGDTWTFAGSIVHWKTDFQVMMRVIGYRFLLAFASLLFILPAALLAVRWGFVVENAVLTKLHAARHDRRTKELIDMEFSDLFVRGGALFLAGYVVWFITELTVDVLWTILFNQSLFFGRLGDIGSMSALEVDFDRYFEHIAQLTFTDPTVLTLHLTTGLAAYMLCRLAWYFCYLDLRVRRDCWDLELEILQEAERINAEPGVRA